jgi:RES domain-containing protein
MRYGTDWLASRSHLGLIVPSVVLPLERNIVLNPLHPAMGGVRLEAEYDFTYDTRMFATK